MWMVYATILWREQDVPADYLNVAQAFPMDVLPQDINCSNSLQSHLILILKSF